MDFTSHYKNLAEYSLYEFLIQAWRHIEGDVEFHGNWHIRAVAEHLEACYKRKIKNLLINVPPRSSKTTLISIAFPAWVWLHSASENFMYSSYASSLSNEHALKCRRLIESDWYQSNWGDRVKIRSDQSAISNFSNYYGGVRRATSVGAMATGAGANILVCDDGNSTSDGTSKAKRKSTNDWWDQVWSTRLNNPKRDIKIVVQQRVNEDDMSGHILSKGGDNWVHLYLPMEFEPDRKCTTVELDSTFPNRWEDPRKVKGELLSPTRFSSKQIRDYKINLGAYGYAGQFQQRPAPEEGGIINKKWFKICDRKVLPQFNMIVQSWDTALTGNETSAYSACTTWGAFTDVYGVENVMLLSMWRGKLEYPELREMAKRLYHNFNDNKEISDLKIKSPRVDLCLIEGKASGDPLIADLKRAGINPRGFNPSRYGDKVGRVRLITPLIEGGRVWLKPNKNNRLIPTSECSEFLESVCMFPNGESRDLVDTMTQVLITLRETGYVRNPYDEYIMRPNVEVAKVY